jgi:hypothetical protein
MRIVKVLDTTNISLGRCICKVAETAYEHPQTELCVYLYRGDGGNIPGEGKA